MHKVLYIAGYGRSGSTVLGVVLSSHPELACVGELTFLMDDWSVPGRACSCGAAYADCPLWGGLFPTGHAEPDTARIARRVETRAVASALSPKLIPEWQRQAYQNLQTSTFDYIAARTGASIIVDGSKSARAAAGRFLALSRLANQDVYVLHLVRSGLSTMESLVSTGSNWAIEGHTSVPQMAGPRAAFGWVKANVSASLLGRLMGPERYMLLRYEDFLADPAWALRRIGRFVGFDAEALIERVERRESFEVGHLVGGNRARLEGTLTLRAPSPAPPRPHLKARHRLMFTLLGGWLHRRYGYR